MTQPRIFVHIPAYRDRETQWTLRDMFERARHPEDWKWPPGRIDHWGISAMPSAELKAAQRKIHFATALKV